MNRRELLGTMLSGSALLAAGAGFQSQPAFAQTAPVQLGITKRTIDINGRAASVFGLSQPDGTQGLRLNAGEQFNVNLANGCGEETLVHWHGLTPPWELDGVPGNPMPMLAPGQSRAYQFPAGPGGTHWMHAHTLQEQNLLAAPLIVRTAADLKRDEQEVVILLHDFSFTPAEEILAKLQGGAGMGGMNMGAMKMDPTAMPGMMGHMKQMQNLQEMQDGMMMDVNDIEYDAYLANDRTLADPEIVQVEKGGTVRLRIINGATATGFIIDLGVLPASLTAVDGQQVLPVAARRFQAAMGQRLDIVVELPNEGGAWPVLALREGGAQRTGIILKTAGADVAKTAQDGEVPGPRLDLSLEMSLQAAAPLAIRPADRSFMIMLTGTMQGYTWSMQGADALMAKPGERVEITMHNMSMMSHPMHLHGHHFQVVGINGAAVSGAVRDTVLIPPMAMVTVAFDGGSKGRWPLHCHHLYHMATGMMSFMEIA